MFGLHGLVTPGKEESLKTNGGLMYYQYNGGNSVTELTNRNGDEIEHYRYDAFGNIYTGITSPYNTTGYTGQDYDDMSGLIQMDARWYDSSIGRFTTQDSYMGDAYTSQSLNRYSYVMNNPVNMWDPTGHVPSWVGESVYHEYMSDNIHYSKSYSLKDSWSNTSDWAYSGKTDYADKLVFEYKSTIENTWEYWVVNFSYYNTTDLETGETSYNYSDSYISIVTTETFTQTDEDIKTVEVKASDIAVENEQYIKNLAGNPPKNTNPPTDSIRTAMIGVMGSMKLLKAKDIIVSKTELKQNNTQSLKGVQSELYNIMNGNLKLGRLNDNPTVNKCAMAYDGGGGSTSKKQTGKTVTSLNQAYSIMSDYNNGKSVSQKLLNNALDYASKHGTQTSVTSYKKIDSSYDQYDKYILAWTNYWNYSLDTFNGFEKIDANMVKAMILVESDMGHAVGMNASNDVMQSIDDDNPALYAMANINPKKVGNSKIGYDSNEAKRFGYGALKNLFSSGSYDANKVTPCMSIDFGIRWALYKTNINPMNKGGDQLIQNYNGPGDPDYWKKVKYAMANPVDYHNNKTKINWSNIK